VSVDGRTARRDRNRLAVLDAVIELFSEGDLSPSPEAVARRSGVSLRSVYRYVHDREDLARAAIERHAERIAPLREIPGLGEGALHERIDRFATARLALYERVAPVHRASRLRAVSSAALREQLSTARRHLRGQLEVHFAPELRGLPVKERRAVLGAVDTLTQIESIEHLREHCRLSPRATRDTLVAALTRLLS